MQFLNKLAEVLLSDEIAMIVMATIAGIVGGVLAVIISILRYG